MSQPPNLEIHRLLAGYRAGDLTPTKVAHAILEHAERNTGNPVWISRVPEEQVIARARELESDPLARDLPLYGIPFAVKDNIDVAGMPTTAGCPAYAYTPEVSATVVTRLLRAGAVLIGKTNLDQFATGLVGTRSPYGACHSPFDAAYISGGSSSGSAVAVATGLVSFALGTDTAGSGRVPAAFNNLVGLKPTRGRLPATGVVPACQSLDCVSVFSLQSADAALVLAVAEGFDPADPYSRPAEDAASPWMSSPRIGVPRQDQLNFLGDPHTPAAFQSAVETAREIGAALVEIDWEPFRAAAELLYSGPWVAEREAAIGEFRRQNAERMDPVVARIIGGAASRTAVEAFRGEYRLQALRRQAEVLWRQMDVLLLPTAGTTYTLSQIAERPIEYNSNLGFYTNFVNLMDLAAVAVPAGFLPTGLPFGVTLMAPAFTDRALLDLASRFHAAQRPPLGATEFRLEHAPSQMESAPGCLPVAVVGAHLSGQPLNGQLTERGARLSRTCRTSSRYRLFELPGSVPLKPGLAYDAAFEGAGIEVEVWEMPVKQFGGFVGLIPPPLGIGKVELEDGTWVSGFICEPRGLAGAQEVTRFGGWRAWLAARGGPSQS